MIFKLKLLLPIIYILFIVNKPVLAQNIDYTKFDKWSKNQIKIAKKYSRSIYLTDYEKEVLFYQNLVRINPKLFCDDILLPFIKQKNMDKNNEYVNSLIRDLNISFPTQPLKPSFRLFLMARNHAIYMGERGAVGHDRLDYRRWLYLDFRFSYIGENCDYGFYSGLDVVMRLLIDEDVPSLGHRHNMLNSEYNSVGTAQRNHTKYKVNTVLNYGKKTKILDMLFKNRKKLAINPIY